MGKKRKSGKNTGRKDGITGLSLDVDGLGRLTSDKVYGPGSDLVEYFPKVDGAPFVQEVELEFGSKEFVAITARSSNDTVVRWVLQGSFTYSKGNVASARVDTIAMVSEDPTNGNGDIITYGYGGILSFDGGISIPNPQSAPAWQNALSANPGRTVASYFLSNGEVTKGSKEPFASFGGGKFYQEGWAANPFASNLI